MRTAIERQRRIIEILSNRRSEVAENLAEELGVSVRTIYQDIEILALSYPNLYNARNRGGIHVIDGFYIRRKYLTKRQYELLEHLSNRLSDEERKIILEILHTFKNPNTKKEA